jgi:hypothetical protein
MTCGTDCVLSSRQVAAGRSRVDRGCVRANWSSALRRGARYVRQWDGLRQSPSALDALSLSRARRCAPWPGCAGAAAACSRSGPRAAATKEIAEKLGVTYTNVNRQFTRVRGELRGLRDARLIRGPPRPRRSLLRRGRYCDQRHQLAPASGSPGRRSKAATTGGASPPSPRGARARSDRARERPLAHRARRRPCRQTSRASSR